MLEIYITRHGATEWNMENRLQGSLNSELTESGICNAVLLGKRLSDIKFNVIYSSPSKRALETAGLIKADKAIQLKIVDDLNEISFGDWEGKTQEEIEEDFQAEYANFWNKPHQYNHLGHNAEDLKTFKQRVDQAMNQIIEENKNGRILIVTHGVVIRAIMSLFWDITTEKMWDPPMILGTSLTIVNYDEKQFKKVMLGDTSHMESLGD
ncbi:MULTISPECIES: histidine phosphatase family protein [unclassified Mesobacillus]|uniref:histidine phosphatase family protein n=1 Tax=unclassified Mesobacillus TaxID=2675270 RepID=UPI00203D0CF4|nr:MULTISPECIES: histidine phosphatase family protein [unclassified Mesobacillus]MCM3122982.1 histidine phosphatase family protein [Mesobacillus sp. MER 33]MCM3233535.1 histidine phosphatase family protein [Mesobacillus sp. MER 48]